MSILKKNALAVALVAGLGLAGAASAYTTYTNGNTTPEKVASSDAADDSVTMTEQFQVLIDPTDLVVGRTTGLQVRLNLFNGPSGSDATFDENLALRAPGSFDGDDLPADWVVTIGAGGNVGDNFVVFNVTPPDGNDEGLDPGEIIQVNGMTLQDVEELLADGGIISGQTFFADPNTATEIIPSRTNTLLLQSGNPIVLACDTTDGNGDARIDVADTSDEGGFAAKTRFSPDGSLGGAMDPGDDATTPGIDESTTFDFGNVSATVDPAFPAFTYTGTDEFDVTVYGDEGSNFAAFDSIYLSDDNCDTSIEDGVIDGNEVEFDFTLADVAGGAAGYDLALCGVVDGTTVIDDINPVRVETTFTRPSTDLTRTTTCNVLPLMYNGSVIEVYHINPAANPTAQSFVRIINRSGTSGTVTIDGIDDEGNGLDANGNPNGTNRVTFVLPAYESVQYNSDQLENGAPDKRIPLVGAWGDGIGKWRAIVTAEFAGARVQGLSRNTIDDTVTNLTDADGQGEQVLHGAFDNGGVGLVP